MVKHRFQAQAMVEFALVIVLLLTIIFGILEVGRFLFIKAAVITATREAVRYGSAAGINEAGNLYYQDCDGIRNAARKVAILQVYQDEDIKIEYEIDDKINPPVFKEKCLGVDVDPSVIPAAGDRIQVTIGTTFNLIVPIVPIGNSGVINISSTTSRTILGIIKLD